MTSRRIAELAALILLIVAMLFALPMKAQSWRIDSPPCLVARGAQ